MGLSLKVILSLITLSLINLVLLDQQSFLMFFWRIDIDNPGDQEKIWWRALGRHCPRSSALKPHVPLRFELHAQGSLLPQQWGRSCIGAQDHQIYVKSSLKQFLCPGNEDSSQEHFGYPVSFENSYIWRESWFVINKTMSWFFFCPCHFLSWVHERKFGGEGMNITSIVCLSTHPLRLIGSEGPIRPASLLDKFCHGPPIQT